MGRNTRDTEQPRYTNREELDCLTSTSGAALNSAEDSVQEINLACGQEQLEYQYRPTTPGEEEIYRPPDMIEQPGGLWITGSSMRSG